MARRAYPPSNTEKDLNYSSHSQSIHQPYRQKEIAITGQQINNTPTTFVNTRYRSQTILYEHIIKSFVDPNSFETRNLTKQIANLEVRKNFQQLSQLLFYYKQRKEAASSKILTLNDIFKKLSDRKLLFNPNDVKIEDDIKQVNLLKLNEVIKLTNQSKIMQDVIYLKGQDSKEYNLQDYTSAKSISQIKQLKRILKQYYQLKSVKKEDISGMITQKQFKRRTSELNKRVETLQKQVYVKKNVGASKPKTNQTNQHKKGLGLTMSKTLQEVPKIQVNQQLNQLRRINQKMTLDQKNMSNLLNQKQAQITKLKKELNQKIIKVAELFSRMQQNNTKNKNLERAIQELNTKYNQQLKKANIMFLELQALRQNTDVSQYEQNSNFLSQRIAQLQKNLQSQKLLNIRNKSNLQASLKQLKQKKETEDDNINKQRQQNEANINKIRIESQKLQKKMNSDLDLVTSKLNQSQRHRSFYQQNYHKLLSQKIQTDQLIRNLIAKITQFEISNRNLNNKVIQLEEFQQKYIQEYTASQQKLKDEMAIKEKEMQKLGSAYNQLVIKFDITKKEAQSLNRLLLKSQAQQKILEQKLLSKDLQISQVNSEINRLNQLTMTLGNRISKAESQLKDKFIKNNEVNYQLQNLRIQRDNIRSQLSLTIQHLKSELQLKENRIINAQTTIQKQIPYIQSLEKQKRQLDDKVFLQSQQINSLKTAILSQESQQLIISNLHAQINHQKEQIQRLKKAQQHLEAYLNVHKQDIAKLEDQNSSMKLQINKKDQQIKKLANQRTSLEQEIKRNQQKQLYLQDNIQQLQTDKQEKEQAFINEISGLKDELQAVRQQYKSILSRLQSEINENINLNLQLQTQRDNLGNCKSRCNLLQKELQEMKQKTQYSCISDAQVPIELGISSDRAAMMNDMQTSCNFEEMVNKAQYDQIVRKHEKCLQAIKESQSKLVFLEQRLKQSDNNLSQAQKQIKEKATVIQQYTKKENKYQDKKKHQMNSQVSRINQLKDKAETIENLTEQKQKLEEIIKHLENQNNNIKTQLDKAQSQKMAQNQELIQKLQTILTFQQLIQAKSAESKVIQEQKIQITSLKSEKKRLQQEKINLQQINQTNKQRYSALEKKLQKKIDQTNNIQTTVTDTTKRLNDLQQKLKNSQQLNKQRQIELYFFKKQDLTQKVLQLQKEKSETEQSLKKLNAEFENCRNNITEIISAKDQQIQKLKEEQNKLIENFKEENDILKKKNKQLDQILKQLQKDNQELTREKEKYSENQRFNEERHHNIPSQQDKAKLKQFEKLIEKLSLQKSLQISQAQKWKAQTAKAQAERKKLQVKSKKLQQQIKDLNHQIDLLNQTLEDMNKFNQSMQAREIDNEEREAEFNKREEKMQESKARAVSQKEQTIADLQSQLKKAKQEILSKEIKIAQLYQQVNKSNNLQDKLNRIVKELQQTRRKQQQLAANVTLKENQVLILQDQKKALNLNYEQQMISLKNQKGKADERIKMLQQELWIRQQDKDFSLRALFQHEILEYLPKYKQFIKDAIERECGARVLKSRLVYRFDPDNKLNFHHYIDRKENILLIVQMANGSMLAGFTEDSFQPKKYSQRNGLIMSLTNREVFTLVEHNRKAISYDDYYIIFGNSEIRLKSQQAKIFSNFGIANSYYAPRGHKVNVLLGGDRNQREVDIKNYEFYQLQLIYDA